MLSQHHICVRGVSKLRAIFLLLSHRCLVRRSANYLQDLEKRDIIGEHGDAILAGWKRLLPVIEEEVREAYAGGSALFPEIEFSDRVKNNFDDALIDRIKRVGVCIIRNAIPKEEEAELLADVRKYIKANPSTTVHPKPT